MFKKIFLFLAVVSFSLHAQNKIVFDFDYAKFGYDTTSNYVEFYYSFNQNSLNTVSTDSGRFINAMLHATLIDSSSNDTIVNKNWLLHHLIQDTSELNKSLVGVLGFVLEKGTYKCEISGTDLLNENNKKTITEYILVEPYLTNSFTISDIELASNIVQDSPNSNSIFYKNSFEVIPIPTSVFGENQPVIFYYCELYNLQSQDSDQPLYLSNLIYNSRGVLVSNKIKTINRNINSRVEVGSVIVTKLPTDTYTMIVSLVDSASNTGISSSKRFFIYNPSVEMTDSFTISGTGTLATEFGIMSEEELDDLFEKSSYIATSDEKDQYEKLSTIEGKKEFLYNFWKIRDDNPSTPVNEFYRNYLERVEKSSQRFGSVTRKGWKTDRGRVLLLYGEPNEIERFPNQTDTKPYEIWYYNELEGGVIFVFADLTGFSDYMLLHSTLRGELRDDNWVRRISSF